MIEMLYIGKIVNTHGINGEIKVYPLTDDIKEFDDITNVYIENIPHKITGKRYHKDMVLLKLENINDKTEADKLKGKLLEAKREELKKLEEGQYYICDIVGLTIIDETIGEIGKINDVIKTGSNDVYVTKYKNSEICIPVLPNVIKEVNLEEGYIKINLPKGII